MILYSEQIAFQEDINWESASNQIRKSCRHSRADNFSGSQVKGFGMTLALCNKTIKAQICKFTAVRQGGIAECLTAGPTDRARHIGNTVVNDLFDDKNRIAVGGRPDRNTTTALINWDVTLVNFSYKFFDCEDL